MKKKKKMLDNYENEFALFWIENNILFLEFKTNVSIDLSAAQLIVSDCMQIKKEKTYPILSDVNGVVNINKTARDYFAHHGSVLTSAVAIVANQKSLSFLMACFYIRVSKPQVLTKVFDDKPAALKFLAKVNDY